MEGDDSDYAESDDFASMHSSDEEDSFRFPSYIAERDIKDPHFQLACCFLQLIVSTMGCIPLHKQWSKGKLRLHGLGFWGF